jgi:hypothetical protein
VPSLQTAIAYEIIFKAPLADLLPDLYAEIRNLISRRARTLLKTTGSGLPPQLPKLAFFKSLTTVTTDDVHST